MSNATKNRRFHWKVGAFAVVLLIAAELNMFGLADFIRDHGQAISRVLVCAFFVVTSLFLAVVGRKTDANSSDQTSH